MPVVKIIRKTAAEWAADNPVLANNEIGFETNTSKEKKGNGALRWNDLPYLLPEPVIQIMIDEAVAEVLADGNAEINAHVNDPTPHPAYDSGPSFVLYYNSQKV